MLIIKDEYLREIREISRSGNSRKQGTPESHTMKKIRQGKPRKDNVQEKDEEVTANERILNPAISIKNVYFEMGYTVAKRRPVTTILNEKIQL